MDRPASSAEELRRLHATLDRLLRRMTRRLPGSPREMQVDASSAIAMLYDLEVPNRARLSATLAGLLRELGQRRPDVLRHVLVLEGSLAEIADLLEEPREGAPGGGGAVSAGVRSALATLVCLCGAPAPAFVTMGAVNRFLPGFAEAAGPIPFYAALAVFGAAGGWVWARLVARTAGVPAGRRLALGGAVGFGAAMPLAVAGLTWAEGALMRMAQEGRHLPDHLAFGVLFAAATFGVVWLTTLLLGLGAAAPRAASRLALRCAGAATLAFLAAAVGFDLLGWRVGAPGAEERFTMLVVTCVGIAGAALAGGGVLGRSLAAAARARG